METIQTKCCSRCKVEKPMTKEYFYACKKVKSGFSSHCIECAKKMNQTPERKKAAKKYRQSDKGKIAHEKHRKSEKGILSLKKHNSSDKKKESRLRFELSAKRIEYRKQYRTENKTYFQNYYKENLEKNRSKVSEYRKKRYNNDNEYKFYVYIMRHLRGTQKRDDFKLIWDEVRMIYDMYGIKYHIDHKIPKTWFKPNTSKLIINHLDNLQVIDAEYNLKKSNYWADPVCSEYLEMVKPYIKSEYQVSL